MNRPPPLQLGAALLSSTSAAALVPGSTSPLLERAGVSAGLHTPSNNSSPVNKETRKLLLHLKSTLEILVREGQSQACTTRSAKQHKEDDTSGSSEDEHDGKQAIASARKKQKALPWALQAFKTAVQIRDLLLMNYKKGWSVILPGSDILVTQLTSILSQLVVLASTRLVPASPSTPPFGLQAVCMDIATVLHASVDHKDGMHILQATLHGINGFSDGLACRLIGLYFAILSQQAPTPQQQPSQAASSTIPSIAISSEAGDVKPHSHVPTTQVITYKALIPMLLIRIFRVVPAKSSLQTLQALHKLLDLLLRDKVDLFVDVLQAVHSASSPWAKERAMIFLSSHWPTMLGNCVITAPFAPLTLANDTMMLSAKTNIIPAPARAKAHTWVPWWFPSSVPSRHGTSTVRRLDQSQVQTPTMRNVCRECQKVIDGYGLRCTTGHHDPVHLQCYTANDGSAVLHYLSGDGKVKLAFPRFCPVQLYPSVLHASILRMGYHRFRLVTFFTASVCCLCKVPIWGVRQQGYRCFSCNQVAHCDCIEARKQDLHPCLLDDQLPIAEITVSFDLLTDSFLHHFKDVAKVMEPSSSPSFLDLLLLEEHLSKQLWMLESGSAAGTIIIRDPPESLSFQLHNWLINLRTSIETQTASALIDEFRDSYDGIDILELLNNDTFLDFIVGRMMLVSSNTMAGTTGDIAGSSFEINLEQTKWVFCITNDYCARLLWGLLQSTSRLQPGDAGGPSDADTCLNIVTFPSLHLVSSMLDLVQAISGCLSSEDTRLHEGALMLLTRYCRPSRLISWQALEELLEMLYRWSLSHRQLTDAGRPTSYKQPQGSEASSAKSSAMTFAWSMRQRISRQSSDGQAMPSKASESASNDIAEFKRLVDTYVIEWTIDACNVDPELFAQAAFDKTTKIAWDLQESGIGFNPTNATDFDMGDVMLSHQLDYIMRLGEMGLLATEADSIFIKWLDAVTGQDNEQECTLAALPYNSQLAQLFDTEIVETTPRCTRTVFSDINENIVSLIRSEPWAMVVKMAESSSGGLTKALKWMRLAVAAGASPPTDTISRMQALCIRWQVELSDVSAFCDILLYHLLNTSKFDDGMVEIVLVVLKSQLPLLNSAFDQEDDKHVVIALNILSKSMAASLLPLGVSPSVLMKHELLNKVEAEKTKTSRTEVDQSAHVNISKRLDIQVLADILKLTSSTVNGVRRLVVQFFIVVMAPTSRIDCGPIFASLGQSLAAMTFRCFECGQHSLSDVRSVLLLRMLSGNPTAFQGLVQLVNKLKSWEQRYSSLEAYFNMVTEITISQDDPTLLSGLPALCPVICSLLDAIFDEDEYVRTKVEVLIASFQPKHLERMASCFERKYAISNKNEQSELCSLALRVAQKLPNWQPITFRLLLFSAIDRSVPGDEDSTCSTVALATILAAGGHLITPPEVISLKLVITQTLGFQESRLEHVGTHGIYYGRWSEPPPAAYEIVLPALKQLLDASLPVAESASQSADSTVPSEKRSSPIAFIFFDVLLQLVVATGGMVTCSPLVRRSMLDSLMIVTYKIDTRQDARDIQTLCAGAIRQTASLLLTDIDLDGKLTVLATMQLFLQRLPKQSITILAPVIYAICEMLQRALVHDKLRARAHAFVVKAFHTFPENGLFPLLFKNTIPTTREGQKDFFDALGSILCDHPDLQDHPINDTMKSFFDILQTGMASRVLVSFCHYVLRCYTKPLTEVFVSEMAQFFSKVLRSMSDLEYQELQADCLLDLCHHIITRRPDSLEFLQVAGNIMSRMVTSAKVSTPALQRLLAGLPAQYDRSNGGAVAFGTLSVLPDLLADGLREKQFHPQSMSAVIECYLHQASSIEGTSSRIYPPLSRSRLQAAASQKQPWLNALANESVKIGYDAAGFLSSPLSMRRFTDEHLDCLLAVAKLFSICAVLDASSRQAINFMSPSTSIFAVNLQGLAVLAHPKHAIYAQTVWAICEMRLDAMYGECSGHALEGAMPILDMFTSFRLLLLIIRQAFSGDQEALFKNEARLANVFMPHCETMLNTLLYAEESDPDISPLRITAYNAMGDLVNFIARLWPPSPLLLQYGYILSSLFEEMLSLTAGQPTSSSVQRAMQILQDENQRVTMQGKTPEAIEEELIAICRTDIMASCKLRQMGTIAAVD